MRSRVQGCVENLVGDAQRDLFVPLFTQEQINGRPVTLPGALRSRVVGPVGIGRGVLPSEVTGPTGPVVVLPGGWWSYPVGGGLVGAGHRRGQLVGSLLCDRCHLSGEVGGQPDMS